MDIQIETLKHQLILLQEIAYTVLKTEQVAAGALIAYLGYRLFILGVTGKASLVIEMDKTKAQLLNAAPGLFFCLRWYLGCSFGNSNTVALILSAELQY